MSTAYSEGTIKLCIFTVIPNLVANSIKAGEDTGTDTVFCIINQGSAVSKGGMRAMGQLSDIRFCIPVVLPFTVTGWSDTAQLGCLLQ